MGKHEVPPVVLCILDGWGYNQSDFGNAIRAANTPNFDILDSQYPPIHINASGEYVGLPDGQMGNSEVGHLNIGAGRVIRQELPKINHAIKEGAFFSNPVIDDGMKKALQSGAKYHLIGLLSDGGVHSHIEHVAAFLKKAKQVGLEKVFIHPLMDGRDTPPNSGIGYMRQLVKMTKDAGVGTVATVCGRYWGMDRDNRWDRVEKAYDALVRGRGVMARDPVEVMAASYTDKSTDEFVAPTIITDDGGRPLALIEDGDVVQFFNFRADRVREMIRALTEEDFNGFARAKKVNVHLYCMTDYSEDFHFPVAFETRPPTNGLGETLSRLGIPQFRTAETEKYAHVTFFFNGGVETTYAGEVRRLIPSPSVATYDLEPEMSAVDVTDGVVDAVASGNFPVVIVNLANGDMVGHTGVWPAAIKAVETVDRCVGRMMEAVRKVNGHLLVTADHGNIELMLDENGQPVTSHSTNPVPFYVFGPHPVRLVDGGALCDIAPTILKLIGIPQPAEMTGRPLIR